MARGEDMPTDIVWDMVACMRRYGMRELDVHDGAMTLRLLLEGAVAQTGAEERLSGDNGAATVSTPSAGTVVYSPVMGGVLLTHPLRHAPEVEPGQEVAEGDIIAFIAVDHILQPVVAPCAGHIDTIEVKHDEVVGYHQPLMVIL
ncbi:hypothetical protein B0W47_14265 [Komagataeibacter nataicola]|uniref:Lipoyl-binding domain-containing protein n=1 Tax=Komagataeibacter nataicola TaxID=265960 RepID=A0A9N7H302_9PROT|nr:biotin/lipoyl-containing protein [Komagataeibacter nataicola]AQU88425.1 hypothetical protein B0W47_14265 [Komagataeibacter nataicola]PYD67122.1 hypothetical protein CDI09_04070 [Komagataeibacter nataicola]WEQ54474.1 hypothetical protein LV564_09685 [Komagataeibacter nataicola]WNM08853.1 biotin/lipoyl-containing protein [Komagataeibacter nataicola]GBR17482.1 hypothetical protein AA0616_1057 [Komagataeibacter nataicola NRIC 0616]